MRRKSSMRPYRGGLSSSLKLGILSLSIIAAAFVVRMRNDTAESSIPQQPIVVAAFDTVELPVPSEPVAVGTKLSKIQWKTVSYPKHQVPKGAFLETASIMDAVTVAPLPADLPVFPENVSFSSQVVNPVVERIPLGMRAMTIKVDATTAVEGWAGSGSLVDVLLIAKDRTTVVAEKVRILSAERSTEPVEGMQTPSVPTTVTLLVTQEQCLAINTAVPLGRIAFALRSSHDEDQWSDKVYTAEQLKNKPSDKEGNHIITGYLAVKDEQKNKAYALANGRWIPTDVKPSGFLVGDEKALNEENLP